MRVDISQIEEASQAFDAMAQERHLYGQSKYGETTFLDVDTIDMALEEVVDLANYARYTFVRLYLLQRQLKSMGGLIPEAVGSSTVRNPHSP